METGTTDWERSVGVVVVRDGKVLLGRHTYGPGRGLLIIPGGYLDEGETPEDAARREVLEETGITVAIERLCALRFNAHDWYAIFSARYVLGEAMPGDEENSEVVWVGCEETLVRDDVPELTKVALRCALEGDGLGPRPYEHSREKGWYSLYG